MGPRALVPTPAEATVIESWRRPARPQAAPRHWWATAVAAAVPILAAAWIWYPILGNYFVGDDFANLFLICNAPILEYLLTPHAGHVEVVRNAIFYATARLFGTDAHAYFLTVWLTHLVNVGLLFATVRRLTDSAVIACVAAILFGTCPAIEGSLGWYSVFGHVLVGTALLAVLVDAAGVRRRSVTPGPLRLSVWAILALAGASSFGVGVAVAMALPFALAWLVPAARHRRMLPPLWPLLIAVPLAYVALYVAYHLVGHPAEVAKVRGMTADLRQGVVPAVRFTIELIVYALDRLLAGPLPLHPYPSLGGTLLGAAFAALALWCVVRGRPARRQVLLAALVLTVACYAIIGSGRIVILDMMERSEAVAQLRYHYVGLITLSLAVAAILATIGDALPRRGGRVTLPLLIGWIAIWLTTLWLRPPAIDHHNRARLDTWFLGTWFQTRARETPAGQDLYLFNGTFQSVGPYFYTRREFPGWAGFFSIYFPSNTIDGHRVFFVEPDPDVREAHRHARRLAGVLVAPADAPTPLVPWSPIDPVCPLPRFEDG